MRRSQWSRLLFVSVSGIALGCSGTPEGWLEIGRPLDLELETVEDWNEAGLPDSCMRVVLVDPDCSACRWAAERWSRGGGRDSLRTLWVSVGSREVSARFAELLGEETTLVRTTKWTSAEHAMAATGLWGTPATFVIDSQGVVREQRAGFAELGPTAREWCE